MQTPEDERVSIRLAVSDDHRALIQLAELDSGKPPLRPALVADVNGEIVAALSLRGGRPLGDPFRPTAAIVELLELRRRQLTAAPEAKGVTSQAITFWRRLRA
ncbi:MAG: hypothetical protein QOE65_1989 [Solirubrobacteraceae bacterium]|jgi:hypothetical protein|nr:hypothetical protein [Solirubrobacteraceae bacterium]